jgi:phosphatidylglycerophosphate synthase
MFKKTREIYLATRKKHDLLFNAYFMRPIAAFVVGVLGPTSVTPNQLTILNLFIFSIAVALFVALPSYAGGLIAVGVLEFSYLFDCADGMLARHKKMASKTGHMFDFFTDEVKATLLVSGLGVRLYRTGGLGIDGTVWPAESANFLLATIGATVVIASALSLTNFTRRPEISGKETGVEAYYETVERKESTSIVAKAAKLVMSFLQFFGHYPSHLWIFAFLGRFEIFFWVYAIINLLYVGRGWLGLILRFGRSG